MILDGEFIYGLIRKPYGEVGAIDDINPFVSGVGKDNLLAQGENGYGSKTIENRS